MNHLVFGYFTAALLATASIALAASMQFLVIGLRQRREPMYLTFSWLCLCVTVLAFSSAWLDVAGDLATGIRAMRVLDGAAVLAIPALVLFVGSYTRQPIHRHLLLAIVALTLLFFWINMYAPYGVLDSELHAGVPKVLPWGESLFSPSGTPSAWGHAFRWLSYAAFLWALYRATRQYHGGQRLRGAMLGLCLLIQFLTFLWGAIAVNTLDKPYPSLDAFAFLSFVLLMSLTLASQLHSRTMQLEQTAVELRAEADTRREAELDLGHAAYHDALTGLPNRLSVLHTLSDLIVDAEQLDQQGAVLLIDLDNFKTINDSLGHHAGDRVLEATADKLLAWAPASASVARLGGDEFVMLLSTLAADNENAAAQAMSVAENMLEQLATPLTIDNRVLGIGASIGVATFPNGHSNAADILRCADIALYRAKSAGRNAARLFLPHMQSDADDRLALERGLRTALERQEFSLHFQPLVNMAGHPVGAEALLRWNHPQLGNVPPSTFIPVAEETGLIHALGTWVIAETCRFVRRCQQLGVNPGGRIAVNVSPWQIAHPHFVQQIEAQLLDAGVAPSCLTLELTESALLNDFDAALRTLQKLSAIGFCLAMDDFGTGYSSLAYLQQLSLDALKIDRTFVGSLNASVTDPLVGFIIDIGHRLGMTTIAEGVETLPQKHMLESLGCDVLQGYLICKPLPEAEFLQWLNQHAAASTDQQELPHSMPDSINR